MIVHTFPNGRRKYQCDVCGKIDFWTEDWSWYGAIAHQDTCPELIPHLCSDECLKIAEVKIRTHEWELPVIRNGYQTRVSKTSKGYGINSQPSGITG